MTDPADRIAAPAWLQELGHKWAEQFCICDVKGSGSAKANCFACTLLKSASVQLGSRVLARARQDQVTDSWIRLLELDGKECLKPRVAAFLRIHAHSVRTEHPWDIPETIANALDSAATHLDCEWEIEARARQDQEQSVDYAALDDGIRDTVRLLNESGFETTDSGDGVSKPSDERVFEVPHVACHGERATMFTEADRLQALLGSAWRVEASYAPQDGSVILLATKGL